MKWGILATGIIASKFASTINQMEGQELIACASRSKEKAEIFAEEHRIPRAYGLYEELVQDQDVEVIYIATPNNLHYENCLMCIEAGKHVLCEKPFTVNAKEAEQLFKAAEKHHVFIMEALWTRFLPGSIQLQEVLQQKEIGEVVWSRCEFGFASLGARKDRKFDSKLAGGALLDIGIYNLGFMRMIMKEEPISFQSTVTINAYGTDEFSSILLQYSEGKSALVTTSIGIPMERTAVIYGTAGNIIIEDHQFLQRFIVKPNGREPYTIEIPFEVNGFEYQILETEKCIRAGIMESMIYPKEDILDSMKLMDKIRKSWNLKFDCES